MARTSVHFPDRDLELEIHYHIHDDPGTNYYEIEWYIEGEYVDISSGESATQELLGSITREEEEMILDACRADSIDDHGWIDDDDLDRDPDYGADPT